MLIAGRGKMTKKKKSSRKTSTKKKTPRAPPEVQEEPEPEPEPDEEIEIEDPESFEDAPQPTRDEEVEQLPGMGISEPEITQEQILALLANQTESIQKLAQGVNQGLQNVQNQGDQKISDFNKRLDNLEQSVVKLVEFIKAQAAGVPMQEVQQPDQLMMTPMAQGEAKLQQQLGPLGDMVVNALKPKDPYAAIGEAMINNQLKILTDPAGDPVRQVGQAVIDQITSKGVSQILNPQEDEYHREYMKAKAKKDAERDSIVEQAAVKEETKK